MRVIRLAGWSGAGKSTLIVKLIPYLRENGLSASTLKHTHHAFDVDQPSKDTYLHREAGACPALRAHARAARSGRASPCGAVRLHGASRSHSGYKRDTHAKIEVHRLGNTKPFVYPEDATFAALATDATEGLPSHLPCVS
jgi:molybdopterin-guanine dinucleotide biosynthesis adapter protein